MFYAEIAIKYLLKKQKIFFYYKKVISLPYDF